MSICEPAVTASAQARAAVLTDGDNTLLRDAIDMHVHGYPELGMQWRMRTTDLVMVDLAQACGMAGIVLKSHFWPAMDRAHLLQESLGSDSLRIFSSITLNPLIGGLQPTTVEAAALHGARVVFMPTWGAANDVCHGGVVRRQLVDNFLPSLEAYLGRCRHRGTGRERQGAGRGTRHPGHRA